MRVVIDINIWWASENEDDEEIKGHAFTDGATIYCAKSPTDKENKEKAGLGRWVWRLANGKDGLWDANLGPPCFAESEGKPVKICGLFGNGRLEYFVLPMQGKKMTNMNGARYNESVKTEFVAWRRRHFPRTARADLIQDHEQCLHGLAESDIHSKGWVFSVFLAAVSCRSSCRPSCRCISSSCRSCR